MKIRNVLAATTAATAMFAGAAIAESHGTMKIGITQNNVGVDSYQTTYEPVSYTHLTLPTKRIV